MPDMTAVLGKQLVIDHPNDEVKEWCDTNLVIPNPMYAKKLRLGHWMGNTPKTLSLYSENGTKYILPYGCAWKVYPILKRANVEIESDFAEHETIVMRHHPLNLLPYQEEAVVAMLKAGHGILKAPAGSGKTQMALEMCFRLGKKALWLCHTIDLVKQSYNRCAQYAAKAHLGIIYGGKIRIGEWITFATVQTLTTIDMSQLQDEWDVVIVDECHHVTGTPANMTMYCKVLSSLSARHKYGLTATAHRADGMLTATFSHLGGIMHNVPDEAVSDRVIPVTIFPILTELPDSYDFRDTSGQLNYVKLINYVTTNEDRNKLILSAITDMPDCSILILSERINQLEWLYSNLPPEMAEKAVMITGAGTSKREKKAREDALEQMRTGEKQFLFATFKLAQEGLDIPRLERLVMASPVKDQAVVVQSIGRVARVHPDKDQPLVVDFIDQHIKYLVRSYKQRARYYKMRGAFFHGSCLDQY